MERSTELRVSRAPVGATALGRGRKRGADPAWIGRPCEGIRVAARVDMPRSSVPPVERSIADAVAFDLSDTDDSDIGDTAADAFATRETRRAPHEHDRAHRADDAVAVCALLVFQDRRRSTRRGARPLALPGL